MIFRPTTTSGAGTLIITSLVLGVSLSAAEPVRIADGLVTGKTSADSIVRIFEGIPYAAPPTGNLRWKPPRPVANWKDVRQATTFGPRCMQAHLYSDMIFRDSGPSEDCLSLNVWTPAGSSEAKLPVMVWIYGGGFTAGASSEPRQDGEQLARKGVVVVSLNYRLGVFGFFAHPELAKESGHDSSGNYGLLDQVAALRWVQKNIAAFGGDPTNVTIFGESAGSFSVSALMASPLTSGLFGKAIGESGAFFSATLPPKSLSESEEADGKFASSLGATTLEELRAKSADALLQAAAKEHTVRFAPNIDGYFLPQDVYSIYAEGKQRHVPLLAGWNADEGSYHSIFNKQEPTVDNYKARLRTLFGDKANSFFNQYPAATAEEAKRAAQDLSGDQFIGFSTWKWIEMQSSTGAAPVYRYRFEDAPPVLAGEESRGAYHSSEIEFVFENLRYKNLPWRPHDRKLSDEMSSYWTNFAKNGDPNGAGLPKWPAYRKEDGYQVMHLGPDLGAKPDANRARYELLDSSASFQPKAH